MDTLRIVIDVETIPTQNPLFIEKLDVKCPGNITKADSIEKWTNEKKPGLLDNALRNTALDSTKGELIVLGWAINDDPPQCVYRDYKTESERDLLEAFYDAIHVHFTAGYHSQVLWIGHNILSFDLPFIWHRTKIMGVEPLVKVPYNARPWSANIFDTKLTWKAHSTASSSLEAICNAIGIPVKEGMHGSEVWDYAQRGEIQAIADYCMNGDVVGTRSLYNVLR